MTTTDETIEPAHPDPYLPDNALDGARTLIRELYQAIHTDEVPEDAATQQLREAAGQLVVGLAQAQALVAVAERLDAVVGASEVLHRVGELLQALPGAVANALDKPETAAPAPTDPGTVLHAWRAALLKLHDVREFVNERRVPAVGGGDIDGDSVWPSEILAIIDRDDPRELPALPLTEAEKVGLSEAELVAFQRGWREGQRAGTAIDREKLDKIRTHVVWARRFGEPVNHDRVEQILNGEVDH